MQFFKNLPSPLISADDTWMIWTFLIGMATLSLVLENRYRWAKKITGPVIALIGGMLAASLDVIPTESPVYDVVGDYLIPIVIPLLLLKINLVSIFRDTGRMMLAFHLASLGTIIGTAVAFLAMRGMVAQLDTITPAMAASYIGGGVNFYAMIATFKPPQNLAGATIVADNAVMAMYFMFLIMLPGITLVRWLYPETEKTRHICRGDEAQPDEDYWKPKPIALLDISKSMFFAVLIATVSVKTSEFFGSDSMPIIVQTVLGQKYLVLTTFSLLFPLSFPKTASSVVGNEEIATFLIFIFFVAIGVPANIVSVVYGAPWMFVFCAIILAFNFITVFALGKFFRLELEEIILAGATTAGGPMNGVAIAISMQWNKLIIPAMMVGIWGYIIGNYIGFAVGKAVGL